MEEADRLCSRLAIIDNGKIVVEGSPTALKRQVGADTVVLELAATNGDLPAQRAEVRRLLDGMVAEQSIADLPSGVSLAVPNAGQMIPQLLRRLDGDGVQITGLQMSQPSLDTVFMQYTGRSIRTEAADQPIIYGW
jgi:ABC-2 type transport system ATP-binding protein